MASRCSLAWLRSVALLAGVIGLGACRGPCEKVCVNLATYAEECGFTVSDAELDARIDALLATQGVRDTADKLAAETGLPRRLIYRRALDRARAQAP